MDAAHISADIPLPPGTLLQSGKYRVERLLGQGAFGQVYLVTHMTLNVQRALKVLRRGSPNLGSSEFLQYRERFQLEAQLGAQIQATSPHPHLVQIYDFWQEDNLLALEMEYAPGGSLAEIIRKARDQRQPLPLEQALRLAREAALGLAALHARDLVHRDVKPSNILLNGEGHAKLADLGLVQTPYSRLSRSDGLLPNHPGTVEYMPPEQRPPHTDPLRSPADVYALGCVLFELLTGRVLYQQREGARVRSLRPEVPPAVDELVARMGSASAKERPWDGEETAGLLQELIVAQEQRHRQVEQASEREQQRAMAAQTRLEEQRHQEAIQREAEERQRLDADTARQEQEARARRQAVDKLPRETKNSPRSFHYGWITLGAMIVVVIAAALLAQNKPSVPSESTTAPTVNRPTSAPVFVPSATFSPTLGLPATKSAPVPAKASVRINLGSFPDNLDPQQASFVNDLAHLRLVYEGLTRLDKDLKTVPAAAESWTYNADATEITFKIRPGLTYSDGSLLNARRFEYSILRNIDPATAGDYASITDDIKGAPEWRSADLKKATPDELARLKAAVKVQALDTAGIPCKDYTQANCLSLKIGFDASAPYFHTVASLWVTYPAKEEIIKTGTDTAKWWLNPKNHIGNGPMVWSAMEEKQKSVFIPSTTYWRGMAKVNLEYRYISDSAVAYAAYKNDEFDIITLGAEDLKITKANPTLSKEIAFYPGSCTYAVMFHQQKAPFNDPKVRAAFAYALDREGWVKDVLSGLGAATLTWIPKGFPGYDASETRWGYDPVKAKAALAESTYKTVDKLPLITLTFSDSPRNRTRYEWLAARWKEVLGVNVKVNPVEATAYTALTKDIKTAPQAYILGWCADYPDPQNWLSVLWKTGGIEAGRIGYTNADLDKMITTADNTANDPEKRMVLYAEAQKLLTDSVPVAFMWNNVNSYLVKSYVKGITQTAQDSDFPGSVDVLSVSIQK